MKVELVRHFFFEAAHRNPAGGPGQQRVHGHSYWLDVVVGGEVESEYGWLMDYGDIKQCVAPVYEQVDHRFLNDIPGLTNTTLPGLRAWLLQRFEGEVPNLTDVRVGIVGDCGFAPVELPAESLLDLPARWRFTFEAAQSLPQLPVTHQCRNLHGHSYRIEIGTRDLLRARPALAHIYDLLDHTCLNDVPGLQGTTCEHLCEWVWEQVLSQGREPTVVIVQETESARCIYHGP